VVSCAISHELNDDPIRFPGHPGVSHRHTFFGNASVNAFSTSASLSRSGTTCNEKGDRAAYWLPAPTVGRWKNMRAYYSAGAVNPVFVRLYPDGTKLVSGSDERSVAWSCGRAIDEAGWTAAAPICPPTRPLSVRVTFGQCLTIDGDSARFSANHECPVEYPVATPLLRLRADWDGVPRDVTKRMLSSGPLESMHADFLNAWDRDILSKLTSVCIRGERKSNSEIKRCRLAGTGPNSIT
jgi:Domain of unknown function (DUF1996)